MSVEDSNPLSVVLEPAIVGSILLFGVWINRNKKPAYARLATSDFDGNAGSEEKEKDKETRYTCFGKKMPYLSTAKYASNRASRFLQSYPFVLEVFYLLLTYWVYQICRALGAFYSADGTREQAERNAIAVVNAEKAIGIFVETDIQKFIIAHPFWIGLLNRIYSFVHIPATCTFFVWLYYSESHTNYSAIRRTMCCCNMIAFIIFTVYPCLPPRLLPSEYGFIDTVHSSKTASIWTTNKFCNQYAAMPSLHFGYSFLLGMSLIRYGKIGRFNLIALLYPSTILLAIIATGNHFILDAVAGFFVAILGFSVNKVLLNLLPVENYILYGIHLNKPLHKEQIEEAAARNSEELEEIMKLKTQEMKYGVTV